MADISSGLPSRSRTCDLRLRRPLLYPAELWAVGMSDFNGLSLALGSSGEFIKLLL